MAQLREGSIIKKSGEDITITVPNIYGDNIPSWIDIVEIDNNFYIKGQEPKIEIVVEEKKSVKKSNKAGWNDWEEIPLLHKINL